jgi:thiamine biosynthesis lipoprotein
MGTLVTIHVVPEAEGASAAISRAFEWFFEIERRCTRFDPTSELMQLTGRAGEPVPASPILYEAVQFAVALAEETLGAFDPAVGHRMAARGFNREHRTGEIAPALADPAEDASYKDVELDPERRTITLRRALTLDLGAVAKGLAVDTAAKELAPFRDFAIDAGGDLYLGGLNPEGEVWKVGIDHPRGSVETTGESGRRLIDVLRVSDRAVCTSGDYEKGRHILDPRTGEPAASVASATVIAPSAMLADALATAAFVLGPREGIALLNRLGVDGLLVTPDLERHETGGLRRAA